MTMHVLSERDIKRAPDGMNPTGTKNLFLQVQGDSRSWIFRYRSRRYGCQKKIGLGSAATFTLSDARILADRQHALIRDNIDPWDANRKRKTEAKVAAGKARTVDSYLDEWMATNIDLPNIPENTKKSARQHLLWISRAIGPMPIGDVIVNDLLHKLGLIALYARPTGPALGIQVFSYAKRVFEMAENAGDVSKNPAVWSKLKSWLGQYVKNHRSQHRAALRREDAPAFMAAVRAYKDGRPWRDGRMTSSYICEFVALTGVRISEVCEATWSEIDEDLTVWTVPWQHLKNGRRHYSDLARPITTSLKGILEEMRRRNPDRLGPHDPVFPNDDGNPYNTGTILRFIKNSLKWSPKFGKPTITVHGFRTTLTGWGKKQRKDNLVEIQLDHMPKGNVAQAYGTQNDDWPQRCVMMEEWDQFCSPPLTPDDKIVRFSAAVAK
jgi:integrase